MKPCFFELCWVYWSLIFLAQPRSDQQHLNLFICPWCRSAALSCGGNDHAVMGRHLLQQLPELSSLALLKSFHFNGNCYIRRWATEVRGKWRWRKNSFESGEKKMDEEHAYRKKKKYRMWRERETPNAGTASEGENDYQRKQQQKCQRKKIIQEGGSNCIVLLKSNVSYKQFDQEWS